MPKYRTLTGIDTHLLLSRLSGNKPLHEVDERHLERLKDQMKDMLRYDEAFVNDEKLGVMLTFRANVPGRGKHRSDITPDRWLSMGFLVRKHPDLTLTMSEVMQEWDKWYSMRHPYDTTTGTQRYEKVTLHQWLTEVPR
jgi:hypothetical protein